MSSKLCLTASLLGQFPTRMQPNSLYMNKFCNLNYLQFLEASGQESEEQPRRHPQCVQGHRSSVVPAVPERDRNPGYAAGTDAVRLMLPGMVTGMVGAMGVFGLAALGIILWLEPSRPDRRSKVAQIL